MRKKIFSGYGTAIFGDCLEYIEKRTKYRTDEVPFSADLVLTDPPYGIFKNGKGAKMNWKKKTPRGGGWGAKYDSKPCEWDEAPPPEFFEVLKTISEHQIIFGFNHFGIQSDNFIVWDKMMPDVFTLGQAELASVSAPGNPKIFRTGPQDPERFHPTQKPVRLFEWILRLYSRPDALIFDPFAGSFTTAIACINSGRRFICIEKEEEYFLQGVERIEKAIREQRLVT